jgi:thiol-disulfide isomerase/thioredoxin
VVRPAAAAAAPLAAPDTWISPQAQVIRDRVNAAYSALEGWTATIVDEQHTMKEGVAKPVVIQTTERYLKSGGPTGYYAVTNRTPEFNLVNVTCQDLAEARFVFLARCRLGGTLSPADELNRPQFWRSFELSLAHTNYVCWAGQETVNGQTCDIVELTDLARRTPEAPQLVTGVTSTRYYVNAAGLIERITSAGDEKSGTSTFWSDRRITYDANAKLTPADFSRESFERDAAVVLQGQPMPELQEDVHAVGGSLPDLAFIGWADGKSFRISDLKGKVVVLETWASWCHFCKEAFPFYEKTRKALVDQDVVFVAVSFDGKLADYEKWMKEHGDGYGFKFARVDSADIKKAIKDFRAMFPAFYVLGRDGKITSTYAGYGYGSGGEDPRLLAALRANGIKI